MSRAYVLMTAMPPTKGHMRLIEFASRIGETAEVILATQPNEPYPFERLDSLREATNHMNVNIHHIHKNLPQEPDVATGFWDMWLDFLQMFGLQSDDYIVASEMYGAKLAEISGATFMPYDVDRDLYFSKATRVRDYPLRFFDEILPEFQPNLIKRVTVFGAESTGKTTLSKSLAYDPLGVNGHWMFEYARPYLEKCGIDITTESMTAIWKGQKALQEHAESFRDKPFIVQDTDLFSTVGYWDFWDMGTPNQLKLDAYAGRSDLYLITKSNIPFEEDPIRYGGDQRESDDQYWISLCESYNLNYVVVHSDNEYARLEEARRAVHNMFEENFELGYSRIGNS